ncbi:hypothetical protein UlMin_039970 [Ulmus minor]
MVPSQNLSKQQNPHHHQHLKAYVGFGEKYYTTSLESCGLMNRVVEGYEYCSTTESCLGSEIVVDPMAEDESRSNSLNEAGSSSKEETTRDEGWLQLSIGGHTGSREGIAHNHTNNNHHHHQFTESTARLRGSGMIELDLLPGGSSSSRQVQGRSSSSGPIFQGQIGRPITNFSTSFYFQGGSSSSSTFPQQEQNWGFRPTTHHNIATASTSLSSCSSSLVPMGSSFFAGRQFQLQPAGIDSPPPPPPPSFDFRVVNPPRRPQSGIWFMLQASQNQAKEPFLPQISKSFLRIKDGKMTVQLLIKYLVHKLRLESESEIEIRCRGQELLPGLTLQHVRDNIWSSRDTLTLLSDSSTTNHLMVLHYGRTA